jgi:hypothetical protein
LPYEEDETYLGAIQLRHGKPLLETPLLKKRATTKVAITPEFVAGTNTGGNTDNTTYCNSNMGND